MYHLGIDLGGTNIAVGVVDNNYNIIGRGKVKTNAPRPAEEICDDMYKAAKMAVQDAGLNFEDISTVGVGSPGSVNPKTGVIGTSNNLRFNNVPMGEMLKERFKCDVFMENDASAAAYGEFIAGAGVGTENFVAITLGTGVGSGIIIDGKLFAGHNFSGGELGHTVIVYNGLPCTCGRKGCWEAYASATGLINLTKRAMEKDYKTVMWELCGNNIKNVNGRTAYDGMRANDKTAIKVVEEYTNYVACGIINTINTFQPEVLCIGGGISKEGDNLTVPITKIVEEERFSKNIEKQTEIKIAKLGNDAGIIGAAFLFRLCNE